jgi:hypothetical protein
MDSLILTNTHLWNFIGLLFILLLASVHAQAGSFLTILLSLPSTLIHEIAHALAVTITGGQVVQFSIFPKSYETPEGKKFWALGHVLAKVGLFSAFPYATAPLIFLPAAFWVSQNLQIFPGNAGGAIFSYWVMYVLIRASFLSVADMKILYARPGSTALYAVIVAGCYIARDLLLAAWHWLPLS